MGFDECYHLGNVVKTHGLRGELIFFLDVDDPSPYKEMESVFIDVNGKLVPFFIESIQLQGDRVLAALEDIEDIATARELVGKNLYLPLNKLPVLPAGKYYFHQLIGFEVFHKQRSIGTVSEIFQLPNNQLLGVNCEGKEVLIPLEDEIIREVDLDAKKIITQLPDGLLDVYLEE